MNKYIISTLCIFALVACKPENKASVNPFSSNAFEKIFTEIKSDIGNASMQGNKDLYTICFDQTNDSCFVTVNVAWYYNVSRANSNFRISGYSYDMIDSTLFVVYNLDEDCHNLINKENIIPFQDSIPNVLDISQGPPIMSDYPIYYYYVASQDSLVRVYPDFNYLRKAFIKKIKEREK